MGIWLTQLVEHVTLNLRVVSSSPKLGVEISYKRKRQRKREWERGRKEIKEKKEKK